MTALLLLGATGEPTQILAPAAEPAVRTLLKLDKPIKGLSLDASIQKDRVLIVAGDAAARSLAVMLLHASEATEGS